MACMMSRSPTARFRSAEPLFARANSVPNDEPCYHTVIRHGVRATFRALAAARRQQRRQSAERSALRDLTLSPSRDGSAEPPRKNSRHAFKSKPLSAYSAPRPCSRIFLHLAVDGLVELAELPPVVLPLLDLLRLDLVLVERFTVAKAESSSARLRCE